MQIVIILVFAIVLAELGKYLWLAWVAFFRGEDIRDEDEE